MLVYTRPAGEYAGYSVGRWWWCKECKDFNIYGGLVHMVGNYTYSVARYTFSCKHFNLQELDLPVPGYVKNMDQLDRNQFYIKFAKYSPPKAEDLITRIKFR